MKWKNHQPETGCPSAGCPVELTLGIIGGKWKGMVLYYLLQGTLRFNELKRKVGNVTQRMLTKQLRELEADGIIYRHVYAEVPPQSHRKRRNTATHPVGAERLGAAAHGCPAPNC